MWVPAVPKEAAKEAAQEATDQLKGNRYAIAAADEEQGFMRQARKR